MSKTQHATKLLKVRDCVTLHPEGGGLHSQFCWSTIRFEVSLDFHVFLKTVDGQYKQFQCRLERKKKPAEQGVRILTKCSSIFNRQIINFRQTVLLYYY